MKGVKQLCFRIIIFFAAASTFEAMHSTSSLVLLILSVWWLSLHLVNKLPDRCYMYKCVMTWMETAPPLLHRDLKLQNGNLGFFPCVVMKAFSLIPFRNHCNQIWATTHWQTSRLRRRLDAASSVRCTGRGTC